MTASDLLGILSTSFYKSSEVMMWNHELLLVRWTLRCHSSLQSRPQIFYGIQIWAVSWPFQYLDVVLPEPWHAFLCCVAWCTILLECKWLIGTKDVPSRCQQFGMQDIFDVLLGIYHPIQHLQSPNTISRHASPHHNAEWMLFGGSCALRNAVFSWLAVNIPHSVTAKDWYTCFVSP